MGSSESKDGSIRPKRRTLFLREERVLERKEIKNFYKTYKVKTPPLGKGAIGELREAIHSSLGEKRIIKVLFSDKLGPEEINQISEELNMMNDLNHISIMKVYEYAFDPTTQKIFIVLENFIGRPLFDKVRDEGTFSESLVRNLLL